MIKGPSQARSQGWVGVMVHPPWSLLQGWSNTPPAPTSHKVGFSSSFSTPEMWVLPFYLQLSLTWQRPPPALAQIQIFTTTIIPYSSFLHLSSWAPHLQSHPQDFAQVKASYVLFLKPSPYPHLKSSLDLKPACRAVHVLVYPLSLWGLHDTLSTEGSAQEKTEYIDEFLKLWWSLIVVGLTLNAGSSRNLKCGSVKCLLPSALDLRLKFYCGMMGKTTFHILVQLNEWTETTQVSPSISPPLPGMSQ